MLVTFLKRLSYKNLKTVKTLNIQKGSAKIWRFKVRKKSIFSNKMAILFIELHDSTLIILTYGYSGQIGVTKKFVKNSILSCPKILFDQ
jgi:hypothetical protein